MNRLHWEWSTLVGFYICKRYSNNHYSNGIQIQYKQISITTTCKKILLEGVRVFTKTNNKTCVHMIALNFHYGLHFLFNRNLNIWHIPSYRIALQTYTGFACVNASSVTVSRCLASIFVQFFFFTYYFFIQYSLDLLMLKFKLLIS